MMPKRSPSGASAEILKGASVGGLARMILQRSHAAHQG
jgi:hypothetical protein